MSAPRLFDDDPVTPMMEQYGRIKQAHPDAILFYRLGDFYEMFHEDAAVGSRELEIALTSRQKVPMCGVPHHAVDAYASKLLRRGYKVAICEQVEDPKTAKGVVKREVVKILTPGTAVEVDPEAAKESVFVAALINGDGGWGLALADLASGGMRLFEGPPADLKRLEDELFRAGPKEIVFARGSDPSVEPVLARSGLRTALRSPAEPWTFDPIEARRSLQDHFRVPTLAGFGLEGRPAAVAAGGGLLHYLKRVRRDALALVHRLSFRPAGDHCGLDAATVRNLELTGNLADGRPAGSLFEVIDETETPMGGRLLRSWLLAPLIDPEAVNRRLEAVAELLEASIERADIRSHLGGILDLERLTGRISLAAAHPRDLVALKRSLRPLPRLRARLGPFRSGLLEELRNEWDDAEDLADLLDRAVLEEPAFLLTEGRIVKDGFNPELDELRAVSRSGKSFISLLERRERERTGIGSLKVRYNRVFGYFIEVTKANLGQVPSDYVRKQTLVGSERFLTPELKAYEEKVLQAEERIGELEYRIFTDVREAASRETARLHRIASAVARLDVLAGLAELAARRGYARPEVNGGEILRIEAGRHPVVEAAGGEAFIPNDTLLDRGDDQILIITGPNMGGKSTYLRQVALIVILAQMGSFVPARAASIGVVDRIFTRIGAMDFLRAGQSTFMVEMLETAAILNGATPRSLILLDEIGRGTSTFDGLSLAWAVAEHLHDREEIRAKTLFATHYHELTELALTHPRIKNAHVTVKEWKDEVVFLRKIAPGPSDRSYGIHVAKLAGLPAEVLSRAREILFNLERRELDEDGRPRLALPRRSVPDPDQRRLFKRDLEREMLREFREEIEALDIARLTPLEALNLLDGWIRRIRQSSSDLSSSRS